MEWYDWWRVLTVLVCFVTLYLLGLRFWQQHRNWNPKTLNYWYALNMWTFAGFYGTLQSIYLERPLTPALVLTSMAAFVGLRGVLTKGEWGGSDS